MSKPEKSTLRLVAVRAGVSPATASRALNGNPSVDKELSRRGFAAAQAGAKLTVDIPAPWREHLSPERLLALEGVLAQDPRPSYQDDPERVYGMEFAGLEIRFRVAGGRLTVCQIIEKAAQP